MTTLYEKRVSPGGRTTYEPVAEHDAYNSLSIGDYLICVRPGLRSTIKVADKDHALVLATMKDTRDEMIAAMVTAGQPRSTTTGSKTQKRAWELYIEAGGQAPASFQSASCVDVVDAGIEALARTIASKK